jgi:uncharacterized protein YkwD
MGKARIVSGGTNGEYQVEVLHFRERIEREIASLEDAAEQIEDDLAEVDKRLEIAELEVEEAYIAINGMILQLVEGDDLITPDMDALIAEHNVERAKASVPALKGATALHLAAQRHASWLRSNNTVGHTGENGSSPLGRINAAGYPTAPDGAGGENMAAGMPSVSSVMQAWIQSPGHRANLLRPEWEHIGVGYAQRTDGPYRHFWVVTFGRPGTDQSVQLGKPLPPDLLDMGESMVPLGEALADAQVQLVESAMERDKIKLEQATLLARELEASQRLQALRSVPEDPVQQAWCADRTTTLTGTVATAEIPDEGSKRVIVLPGHNGNTYSPPEHGQLTHREGMSGPQAYLLAAILPGWQKWMPIHRVGTLTAIDYATNTGTVALDTETSSAQDLPVNHSERMENVPIQYMTCNARAFTPNDRVLVEFVGQRINAPRVIGFESHPKLCINWPDVNLSVFAPAEGYRPDGSLLQYDESNLTHPSTFECCFEREGIDCLETRTVVCHGDPGMYNRIFSYGEYLTWTLQGGPTSAAFMMVPGPDDQTTESTISIPWRDPELGSYVSGQQTQLEPMPEGHGSGWAPGNRLMRYKELVELLFYRNGRLTIARRHYSRTWAFPDGYNNCTGTLPPCEDYEDEPVQQDGVFKRASARPSPKWNTQEAVVEFDSSDLVEIFGYLTNEDRVPKSLWVAYVPNPSTGVIVDVSEYRPAECVFLGTGQALTLRYTSIRVPPAP